MKNLYPHHYEESVTNWVLWFKKENATDKEMIGWIEGYEELNSFDLIVYETPNLEKSVRGIRHLQILAKKTANGERRQIYFHSNNQKKLT